MSKLYGNRVAVVLDEFSGELWIPEDVTFEIRGAWEKSVFGYISGPGFIDSSGPVEVSYPADLRCIAYGEIVYVDGEPQPSTEFEDDYVPAFQSEPGLAEAIKAKPDYPINPPKPVKTRDGWRISRSMGNLPSWLSKRLVIVDREKILMIEGEPISLLTYQRERQDPATTQSPLESMSLYSYAMGCLQGLDLGRSSRRGRPRTQFKEYKK